MHPQKKPVALVTGANQGIGLQIAKELAKRGFLVFVGSRDLERGEASVGLIGGDALAIQLDVTDRDSIGAAARRVHAEVGRLDVLVNNAAISNTRRRAGVSLQDYAKTVRPSNADLEEVRAIWETNVFGVMAVTQAMLPMLREAPAGRIVNVSSEVGSLARALDPANPYRGLFSVGYSASKTALNAVTVAFALELEAAGIKVNSVNPGFTKTNLNGFQGTGSVEEGAAEAVRCALLDADGPTGGFLDSKAGNLPW